MLVQEQQEQEQEQEQQLDANADKLFRDWDSEKNGVLNVGDIMNGMNGLSSKRVSFNEVVISKAFNSVVQSREDKNSNLMDRQNFIAFVHQLASQLGIQVEDLFHLAKARNNAKETTTTKSLLSSLHPANDVGDTTTAAAQCWYDHHLPLYNNDIFQQEFTVVFQKRISFLFTSLDSDGDGLVPKGEIITKLQKAVCEQSELDERFLGYMLQSLVQKSYVNLNEFCYFVCCVASQLGIENDDIFALFDSDDSNLKKRTIFAQSYGLWGLFCRVLHILKWQNHRRIRKIALLKN